MKRHLLVVLGMVTLVFSSIAVAQTQEEVISSFEKQVDKFQKFFSSKPKFLEKQSYKGSPTSYIFFYNRFDSCNISYDIQKTDSLISPYMGYINVRYRASESMNCGDFIGLHEKQQFTTLDLARQKRDDESCYIEVMDITYGAKFVFAFQKKKWVYKEVINTYSNKPDPLFSTAFGIATAPKLYVEDNNFWKRLIE